MPKRVLIPFRHERKIRPYVDAVALGGMEPVPMDVANGISLREIEGLLLMGGNDVNPARYGAEAKPETDAPDDVRDQVELDLIDEAMAKDLPIFGICRGLQILNAYCGGTLVQHLPSVQRHDKEDENKGKPAHKVSIEPESLLAEIAGVRTWPVNSRHHQAADRVGKDLHVAARDTADQTIEALERRDKRFVLAVQWHPEDQIIECPEQLRLFRRFAEAL